MEMSVSTAAISTPNRARRKDAQVFTGLDLIANDSRLEVRSSVGVQKPLFEMGCERA